MNTTLLKLLAAASKNKNLKHAGMVLVAGIAIVTVVILSTGGDHKVTSQQAVKTDANQQKTKSIKTAGSKQPQKIEPLTDLRKSNIRTKSGPPTKRVAGR